MSELPVVVVGAGPVGLAAAAHLRERGLPAVVLEAGDRPGAAVRAWGHVRTFTPWQWLVDPVAERLLSATGWRRPEGDVPPTGDELAEHYLEPLAALLDVRLGARVVAVTRDGMGKARTVGRSERPFSVVLADGTRLLARAVLDASGTWEQPNPLGSDGLPVPGEVEARAAGAVVGPLPDVLGRDRDRFAGRTTLVVGSGHSAAGTLLALAELDEPGTRVLWAVRGERPDRAYGGGASDELAARGALGSRLRALVESGAVELHAASPVTAVEPAGDGLRVRSGERLLADVDVVVAATGFRPDLSMLAELQLDLDPALEAPSRIAPLVDPQFHSCGTVPPHGHRDLSHPDEGLYVVGMKSYGRAPTFLVTTGNEQVRSVVAHLAGDDAAADAVELVLPETGVCSVTPPDEHHRALPAGVPAQGFPTGVAACCG